VAAAGFELKGIGGQPRTGFIYLRKNSCNVNNYECYSDYHAGSELSRNNCLQAIYSSLNNSEHSVKGDSKHQ